jgi:hypothetical protein
MRREPEQRSEYRGFDNPIGSGVHQTLRPYNAAKEGIMTERRLDFFHRPKRGSRMNVFRGG